MPIYRGPNNRKITIEPQDRHNDQVILTGVDERYLVPNGAFFLEQLESFNATGANISDGQGNIIMTNVDFVFGDYSPIRCDYGIILTGDVNYAKGFVKRNIFES